MSDSVIKYRKILWNHETGHDKVWVSFTVGPIAYAAWGRRGGKLQFKKHGSYISPLVKLEQQKEGKGYKPVDEFLLFTLFPDFKEKVDGELILNAIASSSLGSEMVNGH